MQHGDVWRALDLIAIRNGLSPSGLAKLAGLDATAFNKSKRISNEGRPRWPSTESISLAIAAIGMDYVEFASLVTGGFKRNLPSLDLSKAADEDLFSDTGAPDLSKWDLTEFPGFDLTDTYFLLEITDDQFEPVYRAGDKLLVSREADLRSNDRIVVRTSHGNVLVAVLVRQSVLRIDLNPLIGDASTLTLDREDCDWMARILWVSQ